MTPLDAILLKVVDWGNETFPDSTLVSKAMHLTREVEEWVEDVDSVEEMSDVLMLMAHLRAHLDRIEQKVMASAAIRGVDMAQAVAAKLDVCRSRQWATPDEHGVVEHIR